MNFFSKIAWTKCKDKWEWSVKRNSGHFWMEMRESVWRVALLCVRLTLGKAWQSHFFISRGVKISLELSINTDYMHVDAVKESRRKDEEKGKCKRKKLESKGSCAISAMGVMTGLLHTWALLCIPQTLHTHTVTDGSTVVLDFSDKVNFMHRLHDI